MIIIIVRRWRRWRRWQQTNFAFAPNAQISFGWRFNFTFVAHRGCRHDKRNTHAHTRQVTWHSLVAVFAIVNEIVISLLDANYVTYVIVNGKLPSENYTWTRAASARTLTMTTTRYLVCLFSDVRTRTSHSLNYGCRRVRNLFNSEIENDDCH